LDEHLVLAARANDEVRRIHTEARRALGTDVGLYRGGPMAAGGVIPTGTMPGPLPDAVFPRLTLHQSTNSINPVLYWHEHVGELVGLDLPPLEDIG
jgi:hypothetical protein